MCAAAKSSQIFCSSAALSDVEADLALLPWFEREPPEAVPGLDAATAGEIARALSSGEFAAKPFELLLVPVADRAIQAAAHPAHRRRSSRVIRRRRSSVVSHRWRRSRPVNGARRAPRSSCAPAADVSAETLDGAGSGGSRRPHARRVQHRQLQDDGSGAAADTGVDAGPACRFRMRWRPRVARGRLLGECSNLARQLTNEPGNVLTPSEFAVRAASIAREGGVKVDILDEAQITSLGMGLLLGVARGSVEPPRLVVFHHDPPGAPDSPVLGLVGKGITFDTGGISIKPADGMERMKDDMAGGAAVICAMRAIGALGAPIRVVGVVRDVREHAGQQGREAGRHPAQRRRQDRRSHQHRCRGTAGARRCPLVRAEARRHASGRRRHADRGGRRRAGPDDHGHHGHAG